MIRVIFYSICISISLFTGLIVGEKYATENPKSSFNRWWRKHIIGEDPER
jgi:hypothetical protein